MDLREDASSMVQAVQDAMWRASYPPLPLER
jgi:hypothetical protein